jgi:hypothetical protein
MTRKHWFDAIIRVVYDEDLQKADDLGLPDDHDLGLDAWIYQTVRMIKFILN